VRIEQRLRLAICPIEEVERLVPPTGDILDLGCGFGALSYLMAWKSAGRQVLGIEKEARRVKAARQAAGERKNLRFIQGDVHQSDLGAADCIVMNDFFHHVPHALQIPLLKKCHAALRPGGTLIIKEVAKSSTWKYLFNYLHDFLRNGNLPFFCLDTPVLGSLLELVGFQVSVTDLATGYPYPHVLYVCTKVCAAPGPEGATGRT
jgi:2-polyprenyl-3-methyl-5-hydroxy-6-metoxy-1,4-benzoquinol methylase